jgi:hypothetical protein
MSDQLGRLYGMDEAERQIRVAKRLYGATNPKVSWEKLGMTERRVFINLACQGEHAEEHN